MFSLWKRSSLCQKLPSDFELKLLTFQKCDSDWKLNISFLTAKKAVQMKWQCILICHQVTWWLICIICHHKHFRQLIDASDCNLKW
jgi:hypothetical protein